jgi:hypothetical protein
MKSCKDCRHFTFWGHEPPFFTQCFKYKIDMGYGSTPGKQCVKDMKDGKVGWEKKKD